MVAVSAVAAQCFRGRVGQLSGFRYRLRRWL